MTIDDDLLLDLGNSRLKWQRRSEQSPRLRALDHARHANPDADIWGALFLEPQPEKVWLASVAGERTNDLIAHIQAHWRCPIVRIHTPAQCAGWTNSYAEPARLGVDRFLAMLGALHFANSTYRLTGENDLPCPQAETQSPCPQAETQSPCPQAETSTGLIVAVAGTALTLDVVDVRGAHLGGLIVPGPTLMRSSLHNATAELPSVPAADVALGRSTIDAIGAGSVRACSALINAVAQDFPGVQLYLSGGAAAELVATVRDAILAPDLIFCGMRIYAAALGR